MPADIVIPQNNEESLFAMARRLGFDSLLLLYEKSVQKERIQELASGYGLAVSFGTCAEKLSHSNIRKVNNACIKSGMSDRSFFENKGTFMVYEPEDAGAKEFIHHRNSGINHVHARLARENKIRIGFSMRLLLAKTPGEASQVMGRMQQNVRLCRKFDAIMRLASFASDPYGMRAPKDMISLGQCLGMTGGEAKRALQQDS